MAALDIKLNRILSKEVVIRDRVRKWSNCKNVFAVDIHVRRDPLSLYLLALV
jgi:hypothetical protein